MESQIVQPGSMLNLIIAISAVVYTIGTLLLWKTTQKHTNLLKDQMILINQQSTRDHQFNLVIVHNSIIDAHREIWMTILTSPQLIHTLNNTPLVDGDEKFSGEFLGSILINHCARIHLAYRNNVFSDSDIDSFARDARYLFTFPLVRWRWTTVKKYHRADFVQFVDRTIES